MNIFKLAGFFNQKLSLAYVDVLSDITKIRQAARNLCQPNIKDLFLQAAEYNPIVEASLDAIDRTSKNYYLTAKSYGLSAQQHAGFLKDLLENINDLENSAGGTVNTRIDPMAFQKLSVLKSKVQNVVPSMVIPPIKPQAKPTAGSGTQGTGSGEVNPASFTTSPTSSNSTNIGNGGAEFDKQLADWNRRYQQREQERTNAIQKEIDKSHQKGQELQKEKEEAEAKQKAFEEKMGPEVMMRAEQKLREAIPRNDGSDLIPVPTWNAQERFNRSFNQ